MMSRCIDRFLLILVLLCVVAAFVHAIYDPQDVTTKPQKIREPLPWHLLGANEYSSRSSKWQTEPDSSVSRKPYVIDNGTKNWSSWRKKPGSEIEHRTEITGNSQNSTNFDQNDHSLEYGQFEQQENRRFPPTPSGLDDLQHEEKNKRKKSEENDKQEEIKDDQDFYEGIPADSTKSRKENIRVPTKPHLTVARYDAKSGVQCPEFDSSGQFVYPPDCKFFVNCWKGRAAVQPCAPGTLFNPDTLECDFPHKVNCYGGEVAEFPSSDHLDSSGKREPLLSGSHQRYEQSKEPRCPPYVTGLVAHPSDCTKFLQCANGGMHIMDCGPGTVFNPAISVCDWPNNVRGCEDAVEKENTTPLSPPDYENYRGKLRYDEHAHQATKRPTCPPGHTGFLPHPDTCLKFLQCERGGTFIMDCGPGTAFNPAISVCDWPYNVPGCKEDKPQHNQPSGSENFTPWSSHGSNSRNNPQNHYRPGYSDHPAPTTPRTGTDWESLRPTWRPSWKPNAWTTARTPYSQVQHPTGTDSHRENYNRQHQYGNQDWGQTQGSNYPQRPNYETEPDPNYDGSYNHRHHHEHHHYPYGTTYNSDRKPETQQPSPPYGQQFPQRPGEGNEGETWHPDREYQHEHHQHGPHYHQPGGNHWHSVPFDKQTQRPVFDPTGYDIGASGQQTQRPRFDPTEYHRGASGQQTQRPFDQPEYHRGSSAQQTQRPPFDPTEYHRGASGQQTQRPFDQPEYHRGSSGQQTQRPPFDQTEYHSGTFDPSNSNTEFGQSGRPSNRRFGQEFTPNRQEYGRTDSTFSQSGYDQVSSRDKNIYVDQSQTWPVGGSSNLDEEQTTHTVNNSAWFKPWNHNQLKPASQNRRWDQASANAREDKLHEWGSRTNLYQSTADKEADSKLDQWASKTNIYQNVKGQHRPGVKDTSSNSYPNSINVNTNGTKGHFIIKDIEVHQNHSRTRTYKPNDLRGPNEYGKTDENVYVDSQMQNFDHIPSMVFEPPLYTPNNRSENKNRPFYGHRDPKNHRTNNSSFTNSEDLAGSDTSYHHVSVPQLPYPTLSRSSIFPFRMNFSSTNIQPPRFNTKFPIGWQLPIQLEPPINEPRGNWNCSNSSVTSFQPSSQLTPPTVLNITNQDQSVSWSNVEPPELIDEVNNTTEGKFTNKPQKKKILRTRENWQGTTSTDKSVPVELMEDESSTIDNTEAIESDLNSDVDVMVEKEVWKPVLVFENKTQTTTESSVIMKINKKKTDVDLFNIEDAPFQEEEPPFPSYYVPPVEPIDHSRKTALPTPISGQVIRLRGGSGPDNGYVEVQGMNPGWGLVCDTRNGWSLKEAHVVCKQLGYIRGAEMAWQGRSTRNGVPTWIAANSVSCQGNETRFQSCKFTHEQECRVERDAIGVKCASNRVAHCRKDEIPHEGQCYHLADPESGLNHAEALKYCSQRQARLIDITSQVENDFISEWLLQTHPEITSAMTSGVGFTLMKRPIWLWEDSSQAKFKFTKWWPGWMEDKHPPDVGARSLCVVMKRKFPCHERPESVCSTDYFFWDTEDCTSSGKGHSYICKRPYDDIGCIYGKGNQYSGTANVTASGKDCLSWGHPQVAHPLAVNVLNREVREKLITHNYCRNPNPNRESRPWCFTGPLGKREHCDIPSCGNMGSQKSLITGQCKPKHFECSPGECIPSPWVCDGEEDCTNGADERDCMSQIHLFQKYTKHKLEGHEVQKWLNTPLESCARRCKEADFICRSFVHKAEGNICFLSDNNVGMTGALKANSEFDYYEMKERSLNCDGMFVCKNGKCINQTDVCDGKNNCNDRSDEKICTVANLDYGIRLAGSDNKHEGRIEVKLFGIWGQVCDDGFGKIDADVICKELGFTLGALEVARGGYFGNMNPPTRFMVDQLQCRGNETSLRECDFDGWGIHDCQPEEAVGVICKTEVNTCQNNHWKCDKSQMCIPTSFICDEVVDCMDKSDESSEHCDAPFEIRLANGSSPLEGRVEVRRYGIWGTVCDDDFSNATAAVICRSLGYGGPAIAKKDGYFGPGEGPIWLDEVFCYGNESQLYRCEHNHWGQHNCNHDEDAGVICTLGDVNDSKMYWENAPPVPETNINDILPANCGRRFEDFTEEEHLVFQKVVHGTMAPKGSYPWQASIRVRGHSRSNHWCGAVILSPVHVLTAAHCLEGYNKGTYFVRAGDYNTEIVEGTEAEANIEDYYIHEEFGQGHRMNNDIALVLLKGKGIPLNKDIVPICLPPETIEYPAGLNCTISGFGSIETGKKTHSKDLRYGWIPLLDQSECRAEHIYGQGAISDGMVCAGYLDEGIDTCDGDSGGPLVCVYNGAFTLYGITSWGKHCGEPNKPGVYVRVSHYRQWIDQKIKESLGGR